MDSVKRTQAYHVFMAFQLQEIYALLFLVDKKYSNYEKIEIETLDDVCLKGDGKILCQLKRVSAQDKRITNASLDLWKTIYNWISFLKDSMINASDDLMLIVECDADAKEEDFVLKLNVSNSYEEVEALYIELEKWYKQHYVTNVKEDSSSAITKYLNEIFKEENKEITKQVFKKFSFMENKENYFEKLNHLLKTDYEIPYSLIESLVDKTISWFKQNITNSRPISIDRSSYRNLIRKFIENNTLSAKLRSQKIVVEENDIKKVKSENPMFVQELLKVNAYDDELITAIDFFIKTDSNRKYYILTNQVDDDELAEFDDSLIYYWSNAKNEVCVKKDSILNKSKSLKTKCLMTERKLVGFVTPYYFTSGSYHILVNNRRVYWYLKELENED